MRGKLRMMDNRQVNDQLPLSISELKSVRPQYKAIMRARKEVMEATRNHNLARGILPAAGVPLGDIDEVIENYSYDIDGDY